jgi:tetratricopeptide (TPR) repeat protein
MIAFLVLALMAQVADDPSCAAVKPDLKSAFDYLEAVEVDQAYDILQGLQQKAPSCSLVIVGVGRVHLAKRDYDRADQLSKQALALTPDDAAALAFRGQMLAMQGRGKEGLEMLERSIKLDPSKAEAFYQAGVLYDRAKRQADAVAVFERVVQLRPNDARAYDYLALNLEPMGKIAEAEQAYKKGLAVNQKPRFDSFLDYNYGRFLLKLNRLPESKVHLDKALEQVPQLRMTHYDHAKLNLRLGNLEAARDDAEKALSIPDRNAFILDLQVYTLLAQIYGRLGDEEKAKQYSALAESTKIPLRSNERK